MPLEDEDPGQQRAPLSELSQDVSPQFLEALRKKIYRRTAANQMVAFSWNLPKIILTEMLMLMGHFFTGSNRRAKP